MDTLTTLHIRECEIPKNNVEVYMNLREVSCRYICDECV